MDESKISFGDKLFLYGHFLKHLDEFSDYEYNSVMGYMTVGGYLVDSVETDIFGAAIPGFVVEILTDDSLTAKTPFDQMEMVDVTDKLSLQLPLPSGTKIWMPTTSGPLVCSP